MPGVLNSNTHVPSATRPSRKLCLSALVSKTVPLKRLVPSKAVGGQFLPRGGLFQNGAINYIARLLAPQYGQHRADGGLSHEAKTLIGPAQRMRSRDHIVESEQRIIGRDRLCLEYVQRGATDAVFLESAVVRGLVDNGSAGGVNKECGWLHPGKLFRANQMAGIGRQ